LPAAQRERKRRHGRQERQHGDEVGDQREPVLGRRREHLLAELAYQHGLDLPFGAVLRDEP
jgi:hypothetical protein